MNVSNLLRKFLPIAYLQPLTTTLVEKVGANEQITQVVPTTSPSNVVSLSTGQPDFPGFDSSNSGYLEPQPDKVTDEPKYLSGGLKDDPELLKFFAQTYFNFGRYHGCRYRSREALTAGLNDVISAFQNILADLIERRQVLDNRIQIEILNMETVSESMTKQLHLRSEQLKTEVANLRKQSEMSEQHKGWVLAPLNEYRLGFDRGVREALAFDLLKV
jgi:hypothetical protein